MPFGLTNALATFQRAVDILMSRFKWRTGLLHFDDIIIFSRNLDEHPDHVRDKMKVLRKTGMTLELRKCEFFADTVKYLGHFIRPGLLMRKQVRVKSLAEAQEACTQTELCSSSGLFKLY